MLYKVFQRNVEGKRTFVPYNPETFYKDNVKKRIFEMYESLYIYEDRHKEILEKTGSLAGITDVMTDKIVFDFDSKEDPSLALNDARELVSRLQSFLDKNSIQCYYSGNKGYHVEIQFEGGPFIQRNEFENIIEKYAGDLKTFDYRIKDQNRVFRFPLSQNKQTKRYKIPILFDEFTDEKIKHENFVKKAENPDIENEIVSLMASFKRIPMPEQFKNIVPEKKKTHTSIILDGEEEKPDMTMRPKFLTPAKYVLSMGFFDKGDRNDACMILAATYKYLGFTQDQAYYQIKNAVNERNRRLGEERLDDNGKNEIWRTNIKVVYSPTWNGATYSDNTHPLLLKTIEKYNLERYYNLVNNSSVLSIKDMAENFIKFADDIDNRVVKTGIEEIDKDLMLTSSMMVGVLGAPSSGKTTLTNNIVEVQSENNIGSFFVSADMSAQLLYARQMQKYCRKSFQEILDNIKKKSPKDWPKEIKDAWDIVLDKFKNVGYTFSSGPTIKTIEQSIDEWEQDRGMPVKFLVVDYLEKLRCDYSDPTAASGYNASRLADVTRNKDLTTFLLLQTQKAAGDPSDELLSMRKIKGASVIEQDCRVVLTTWRPGFNPDVQGYNPDDKFASIAVVKNNMGTTGRYDLSFDGLTGVYKSMNDEERQELERVRQIASERKFAKANGQVYKPQQNVSSGATESRFRLQRHRKQLY